jgi:hypothetical protein
MEIKDTQEVAQNAVTRAIGNYLQQQYQRFTEPKVALGDVALVDDWTGRQGPQTSDYPDEFKSTGPTFPTLPTRPMY